MEKTIYEQAYDFILDSSPQLDIRLFQEDYFIEYWDDLDVKLPEYAIDYLPKRMTHSIYTYEFDYDRSSTNPKWRDNEETYFNDYRKLLLTILGYSKEIYVDSGSYIDLESPHIFKVEDNLESVEQLDGAIISGLKDGYTTIISLPKEKSIMTFDSLFITLKTNNQDFLSFAEKIAQTNGLYLHQIDKTN